MHAKSGFTLVEVLAALVIVALLSALAMSSYRRHLLSARRLEGQVALLETLQWQERYYTLNNTYRAFDASNLGADGADIKWWSGQSPAGSAYEIRATACPGMRLPECVEMHAMPGTSHVDAHFRDEECATLTLRSNGEHFASSGAPRCWP